MKVDPFITPIFAKELVERNWQCGQKQKVRFKNVQIKSYTK